jgi:hypothetical protein
MPRKKPKKLTPEQIKTIEQASALRMDMRDIAALVGCSQTQLEEMVKKTDEVRRALLEGRAKASHRVGAVLMNQILAGDAKAIALWYRFIEQRASIVKNEHSGPEGGPIQVADSTDIDTVRERIRLLKERAGK